MTKRILFLLPSIGVKPIGGFKVIYEYANRLVADGFEVSIVYPAYCLRMGQSLLLAFLRRSKAVWRYVLNCITKGYACSWFKLDPRVKEVWTWSLAERFVPKADICIASSINTSVYVNRYKHISNENKFYFIQGFENWNGITANQVMETYHYPMNKIVIAHWLEAIVHKVGERCTVIPDGFDFTYFRKIVDIESRDRFMVCMLYHRAEVKGCADGLAALDLVKKKYPALQVNMFGTSPRPEQLPEWYHYYQTPDEETHNRLYNEASIFVGTSRMEGWGLTIGEAMICGCAVACTDNLGYLEMAIPDVTALVSPVRDVDALAVNILRLIENEQLRYQIAEAGNRNIRQFSLEDSYKKLKNLLLFGEPQC